MKLIDLLNRTEISSSDFLKIIFKQRLIKFCILPLTKSSMNDFLVVQTGVSPVSQSILTSGRNVLSITCIQQPVSK